jgi:transposase
MPRTILNDQHWSKLKATVRNFNIYLKSNLRNFFEAILYRIRTGCPWRDLPEVFGNPNSIFQKYNRWSNKDKLMKIFKIFSDSADHEWIFVDATHVRAHQHSAGTPDQDISKSVGGNSSKIHLAVDSHGNPIEFIISDGTTHDVKVAPILVEQLDLTDTEMVCMDKGYDSETLREQIKNRSAKANIPKKSNTRSSNDHVDWYLYKIRHLVENAFCRLKQFRGIATRFDKLKRNFQSAVALACIYLWLPL